MKKIAQAFCNPTYFLVITCFLFTLLACSPPEQDSTAATDKEITSGEQKIKEPTENPDSERNIVAKVNGYPIFEDDIVMRLGASGMETDKNKVDPTRWEMLHEAALSGAILDRLLLEHAMRAGLGVDDASINTDLDRTKHMMGEDSFREMLEGRKASPEEYRTFLKERMLIDRFREELFAGITIDQATIDQYYEGHKDSMDSEERVRLAMITVETQDVADSIHKQLIDGEDIDKLAEQFSTARKRGLAGTTRAIPYSALPSEILQQVQEAETNAILDPVRIGDEIVIIKVLGKIPAGIMTLEEARPRIEEMLRRNQEQIKLDAWFEESKKGADIEYLK